MVQAAMYHPSDDEDEYEEEHAATAATAAATSNEYLNEDDEDIDTKDLELYKDMIKCPVCLSNIKDVRLSPCGHMMCKSCVKNYITRRETQCPICKQKFTSFDKVYYGKYLKYKMKYLMFKNKK